MSQRPSVLGEKTLSGNQKRARAI